MLRKHLYPLSPSDQHQTQIKSDLATLRNSSFSLVFILNATWISLLFTIQLLTDKLKDKAFLEFAVGRENPTKYEPVSFIYVILFLVVLLVQFAAMLVHRTITFMQLIRKTSLRSIAADGQKTEGVRRRLKKCLGRKKSVSPGVVLKSLHQA